MFIYSCKWDTQCCHGYTQRHWETPHFLHRAHPVANWNGEGADQGQGWGWGHVQFYTNFLPQPTSTNGRKTAGGEGVIFKFKMMTHTGTNKNTKKRFYTAPGGTQPPYIYNLRNRENKQTFLKNIGFLDTGHVQERAHRESVKKQTKRGQKSPAASGVVVGR